MIECLFKRLKEECTWLHNFRSFQDPGTTFGRWIRHFNEHRPHHAFNYRSPT